MEDPKTTIMSSFEALFKKKNNNVATYTKELVEKDKENGIQQHQLIKFDGNTLVDFSKVGTIEKQLNFIKNNMQLFVDYNGFVVEMHVDVKKFIKGTYTDLAYLLNGLSYPLLNGILYVYCLTSGIHRGSGSSTITINANSSQQPDGSLIRIRQPPLIPNDDILLVHEVNFKSKTIDQPFQKYIRCFERPSINIVILLQVAFIKLLHVYFNVILVKLIQHQLFHLDHNVLSYNNTPITGTLHNNLNLNNFQNNQIYMIRITPPSLFLNTPLPIGMAPLVVDLFNVKQEMDIISKFSASYN
ncbi:hypothetical protein ACTFIY_001762 [Dictyostelium cf. discoideum]